MTRIKATALRVLLSYLLLGGSPAWASNPFYTATGNPTPNSAGSSAVMREEFSLIEQGFDTVPQIVTTGAFVLTVALGATVAITAPLVNGTMATLAGSETLTNKTIVSPALTGIPTSTTASPLTNNTQVATTAYADAASAVVTASLATETARALAAEGLLAPKASPTFTGTPVAPTAAPGTNSAQLATTAFDTAAVAVETARATVAEGLLAPKASPALTGTPTAPTASPGTNTTQIASTAYALAAVAASGVIGSSKIVLGSVTIAWGQQSAANAASINYGVTFSGAPMVMAAPSNNAPAGGFSAQPSAIFNANFTIEVRAGASPSTAFIAWIAIGPT